MERRQEMDRGIRATCMVLIVSLVTSMWAYGSHAPYREEHAPETYPMKECPNPSWVSGEHSHAAVYSPEKEAGNRIMLVSRPKGSLVGITEASGRQLLDMTEIDGFGPPCEVWEGLLNSDNIPDYVIRIPSYGAGHAGNYSDVSFLLSKGDSFSVVSLHIPLFYVDDFVDVDGDGRVEFIHTAFIHGVGGRDGWARNYSVYNLVHFDGDEFVSANKLDWRFPCWIWYTYKPNHRNTTQLTKAQKKKCWLRQLADLFPGAEAFADEQ